MAMPNVYLEPRPVRPMPPLSITPIPRSVRLFQVTFTRHVDGRADAPLFLPRAEDEIPRLRRRAEALGYRGLRLTACRMVVK